jgi:hypothetical protein
VRSADDEGTSPIHQLACRPVKPSIPSCGHERAEKEAIAKAHKPSEGISFNLTEPNCAGAKPA